MSMDKMKWSEEGGWVRKKEALGAEWKESRGTSSFNVKPDLQLPHLWWTKVTVQGKVYMRKASVQTEMN